MAEQGNKKRTSSQAKKRAAKKRKANAYALILAAVVIIFAISIIGVARKHNETLKQTQTTSENSVSKNSTDNKQTDKTNPNASQDTTVPEATTEPVTAVQAMKPGTIDNPTIITIDEENWHLTLVNACYRIPEDYEPDLVYVCGSSERLDRKVAEHYEKMYDAALKDGVKLTPCSGYRSYELQERNYTNKIGFYESQGYSYADARVKAATIIMPPGSSEHNLGYAMDIVCVDEWFEDTAEFKWLTENAAEYGFIMRYPKDKQDITNVIYEPWHWRYVGVELAKELKASGQVLEEYMGVA